MRCVVTLKELMRKSSVRNSFCCSVPWVGSAFLQVRPLRQSTPSVKGPLQGRVSKDVNILKEAGRGCPGNAEDRVMKYE